MGTMARKNIWIVLMCFVLFLSVFTQNSEAAGINGTYEGQGQGRNGDIVVSVEIKDNVISSVDVKEQNETPKYWEEAVAMLEQFIGLSSVEEVEALDAVSGATLSSNGIKGAVCDALAKTSAVPEGSGTDRDPYVITSAEQLQFFASKVDEGDEAYTKAFVVLGADIDLSGTENWDPIGAEGKASANKTKLFNGTFDGQYRTITGEKNKDNRKTQRMSEPNGEFSLGSVICE